MSASGSVTRWINDVRGGCESAAHKLFGRYQNRLLRLARVKLSGAASGIADEDDVVVGAFHSFLRRTRAGSYEQVRGRDDLWKLLATITAHKALNHVRDEKRMKRGGGHVIELSSIKDSSERAERTLAEFAGPEPPPELKVMFAESLERLMQLLPDDELRQIAVARLQGFSNEEIAALIHRSVPTVERRLRLIRDKWLGELGD